MRRDDGFEDAWAARGHPGDEHGELLLGRGLQTGALHPMALAAAGHALARRAGLRGMVAWSRPGWWTVLVRGDACAPIGFGHGTELDALPRLQGCCPHQLAHELLGRIIDRGPAPLAGRAERLRSSLALACGVPPAV